MYASTIRLAGKSADHTLYHAHPTVSIDKRGRYDSKDIRTSVASVGGNAGVGDAWKENVNVERLHSVNYGV